MRRDEVPACSMWTYQVTRALALVKGKDVGRFPPFEIIHGDPREEGPTEDEALKVAHALLAQR